MFREIELSCSNIKKFIIFHETERYHQNPGIFRTRSIFRTLVYSEADTY